MIELNIPKNSQPAHYEFPIIDGKSPCAFKLVNNSDEEVTVSVVIEKFGGKPDPDYA
jgi:hypothetical protein